MSLGVMSKRALLSAAIACFVSGLSATAVGASPACAPMPFTYGSGTMIDPYQIWNNTDLSCLQTGSGYSPMSGVYYKQMADIVRSSSVRLDIPHQIVYDGDYHTITISGQLNFPGLFGNTANAAISNLFIVANSSTTADNAGWLAGDDIGSTFTNIVVNGPISNYGGGIVGSTVDGTTIAGSVSIGTIGLYGGGLVGNLSVDVTIDKSFTTGAIDLYGGGLIGSNATNFTVTKSFSTGTIAMYGGGIVGSGSVGGVVSNSYSTGNIGNYGSGIIRPSTGGIVSNSYTTGVPAGSYANAISYMGGTPSAAVVTNSYGAAGSWNDTDANVSLTGVPIGSGTLGTSWGSCGVNLPYFISAFYSGNPCIAALSTEIEVSGTDSSLSLSRTLVDGPTDNSFSLTSRVSASPFSYVSLVNGTGTVTLGGTSCVRISDCVIRDIMQGPYSRGSFTITGDGTVTVRRFNSFTGDSSTVGTLSVSRIRTATPEVVRYTLTLNLNGGACGASSVTVTFGSSVTLPSDQGCTKTGYTFAGWFDESGSRVLAKELVMTSDRTLSARWSADSPKPSKIVGNRITARISRLALDAKVVRVRGRIIGAAKISDLQVWFKETGMKAFVKSSSPLIRKGRQFTWFHHTSNGIRVYVVANGAEQSKTLRMSGTLNAG